MIYPKLILTMALIFLLSHFIVGYHKRGVEIKKLQDRIIKDSIYQKRVRDYYPDLDTLN